MVVTLKDVAKKVGVHPSTVSRVLSGKYDDFNVSDKVRDLIFKTAKEINYIPNEMARSLRINSTQTIGLVIPDILNPLFAELARSIGMACEERGYSLIVCNTDEVQEKEIKYINMLKSRGVEGLIIVPVQGQSEHLYDLQKQNYPFVLAIRHFGDFETDKVITDNHKDVYRAVEYLLKLGHRRIAFVGSHKTSIAIQDCEKGYIQALKKYNLSIDHDLIISKGYTVESGYKAVKEFLNLPQRPSALMVSSNVIIVGVLEAIFEAGLLIPEDISVVGFAHSTANAYLSGSLTSISLPVERLGTDATELLFKRIESPENKDYEKIVLPSKFIIGNSTLKAFGS